MSIYGQLPRGIKMFEDKEAEDSTEAAKEATEVAKDATRGVNFV